MLKIYKQKNKLVFEDIDPIETVKKKILIEDIGLIQYSYFDDCEDSLLILVFLKKEIEYVIDGIDITNQIELLNELNSASSLCGGLACNNKFEVYSEDEDEIILKTILKLCKVCHENKIILVSPKEEDSLWFRYQEFETKRKERELLKDNLVFASFSKN